MTSTEFLSAADEDAERDADVALFILPFICVFYFLWIFKSRSSGFRDKSYREKVTISIVQLWILVKVNTFSVAVSVLLFIVFIHVFSSMAMHHYLQLMNCQCFVIITFNDSLWLTCVIFKLACLLFVFFLILLSFYEYFPKTCTEVWILICPQTRDTNRHDIQDMMPKQTIMRFLVMFLVLHFFFLDLNVSNKGKGVERMEMNKWLQCPLFSPLNFEMKG